MSWEQRSLLVCGYLVVGKPDVFWARIQRHGAK